MSGASHAFATEARVRPRAVRERGFGLVELMVSMLIGLVIIGALVTLFVNTSGGNRELARANSMIESGRFAIKVLEDDLAHAGYWGGYIPLFDDQTSNDVPTDVPGAIPDPCQDPTTWTLADRENLIGIPVQAYDDAAVAELATCVTAGVIDDYQAGTDLLLVRHADTCAVGDAGYCAADVPGMVYLQVSRCETDANPYVLDTAGFTLTRMNCATAAERRRYVANLYYVRDYAVTAGDGIPTLVRSEFDLVGGTLAQQPAVPLVEGVEAFRIEFGVDDVSRSGGAVNYAGAFNWQDPNDKNTPTNRGDGVPDGDFVRCTTATPCTIGDLMNATSAKIYVLARSREASPNYTDTKTYTLGAAGAVGPFNDNFKRHVFTTTVRLNNIAGRRILP
jgi:type IV pilus assembly protein PilW